MKIRIRLHIGFGPIVGTLRFEQDKKATKNAIVDLSKQLKIPLFKSVSGNVTLLLTYVQKLHPILIICKFSFIFQVDPQAQV